jgi:hypothetical protein
LLQFVAAATAPTSSLAASDDFSTLKRKILSDIAFAAFARLTPFSAMCDNGGMMTDVSSTIQSTAGKIAGTNLGPTGMERFTSSSSPITSRLLIPLHTT